MFIPHCCHIPSPLDMTCTLQNSMLLASAFIVERDLQESRREQSERPGRNDLERSKAEPFPFRG